MARYGILGTVEVRLDDGLVVRPTSQQQRRLLAVLIVEAGRSVSADRLVDAIWGDDLPSDSAGALRTQISRLRRALGRASADVATEDRGYRLAVAGEDVDATRFERLVAEAGDATDAEAVALLDAALAMWRGPALEDVADRELVQPVAVRLDELRLQAEERRAELLCDLGRPQDAVVSLRELIARHPERERTRGLLMKALYRTGRHTDALALYEQWRRRLADDLGLEPAPELQHLEFEILTHGLSIAGAQRNPPSLPRPVTSFLGREDDLSRLTSVLADARLVTLWGPGGVGKTRLALEFATAIASRYRDGVRLCDLSTVRRAGEVARAVATAVQLEERAGRPLDEQVVARLASSRLLLVLDNCEHVATTAARLIDTVLRETAEVDVIVTSRVRLLSEGEHVWPVTSLSSAASESPAVRLFIDRAHAADPAFAPSRRDVERIRQLCATLDGLPLAIELAAARVPGMSLTELLGHLDQRFSLLAGDRRNERHQSLSAVVRWSYDLLTPREQRVFRRLAVFAGRFDLDAARAVASGNGITEDEAVATVTRLVDCSMITVHRADETTTYSLLETLRAFGSALLEQHGELDEQRARHADWARNLVAIAAPGLATDAEAQWSALIDRYLDELRSAHQWLVGSDSAKSLELVAGLHWYALWRLHAELWRWAEVAAAAASAAHPPLLDAVLAMAAFGAAYRGDFIAAGRFAQSAIDAATEPGSLGGRRAWAARNEVALLSGRVDEAVTGYREAFQRAVDAHDLVDAVWTQGSVCAGLAYGGRLPEALAEADTLQLLTADGSPSARAFAHWVLAEISLERDDVSAETNLARALELADHAGARLVATLARLTLATLYSRHRDPREALRYYERAIIDWQQAGAWTSQWVTLRTLVDLLTRVGADWDAAVLYAAVTTAQTGAPAFGGDAKLLTRVHEHLRAALGDERLVVAMDQGTAMSDDAVVAFALDAIERTRCALAVEPVSESSETS